MKCAVLVKDCKENLKPLFAEFPSIVVLHESDLMNTGLLCRWIRTTPKNVTCCLQTSKSGVKASRVRFYCSTTLIVTLCSSLCNEIVLLLILPFKQKIVRPCPVHIWFCFPSCSKLSSHEIPRFIFMTNPVQICDSSTRVHCFCRDDSFLQSWCMPADLWIILETPRSSYEIISDFWQGYSVLAEAAVRLTHITNWWKCMICPLF